MINLDEEAVTERLPRDYKMTLDRGGVYPGGSSGEYDDLTMEQNIENYNKLVEEIKAQAGEGLESAPTDDAVQLSISAADIA